MAVSEAQKKASKKYYYVPVSSKKVKNATSMPIKEAEILEEYCKKHNYSKAGFIREAIQEKIAREL